MWVYQWSCKTVKYYIYVDGYGVAYRYGWMGGLVGGWVNGCGVRSWGAGWGWMDEGVWMSGCGRMDADGWVKVERGDRGGSQVAS